MNKIFVFGSNLAGIHGAGAARVALEKYGAVMGRGIGLHGKSYGIPTKNTYLSTLPLSVVKSHIYRFLNFATTHSELEFIVTQIGCGLAGFTADEIAPLFRGAPSNCLFDSAWKKFLEVENKKYKYKYKYWGTYA